MHSVAAAAHLGQAGALSYLVYKDSKDAPGWPVTRMGWTRILDEHTRHIYIGTFVPMFSALSSVNHAVSAIKWDWYQNEVLAKRQNWLRFTEWSVSAALMTFLICTLSGVTNVRTHVSFAILNVVMMMLGLMIEKRKAENADRSELLSLFALSSGVFCAIWTEIIVAFLTVAADGDPPAVVYSIVWVLFALYSGFAIAQLTYIMDAVSYETVEMMYIGLSLASKSLLAWLVYGGVISARSRFEENNE